MRVLALDYGSARCGCAVSDPTGTIATPLDVIAAPGTRKGMAAIAALAAELGAEMILVGLPLGLDGSDTEQTRETRAFAERLARRVGPATPVRMHDERLTTRMAERLGAGSRSAEDSRAAAHLLESWLAAAR